MISLLALTTLAMAGDFDHDHAAFGKVLEGAVSPEGVDYAQLAERREALDAYLATVAAADASGFTPEQQLALYVNAYNAYTVQTMLTEGPPASIRDLNDGKVWDARTFDVAGRTMTLNEMEHGHARKLADGRVHAVVNCASKGCPPLPAEPLRASTVEAQLTAAATTWATTNAYVLDVDTVKLSKIFDWYGDDFAAVKAERDLEGVDGKAEQALWFLAPLVDEDAREKLLSGTVSVEWNPYDWSLNQR